MGHFGRPPISRAWFFVVFPALTLNYMGQGSLILGTPAAIDNPFFLLIPHWARMPMVLLATVATVIASQAVISGAFSVTRQAVQLGFLPRLTIRHTSGRGDRTGLRPGRQLGAAVAVVALVLGFGSSANLASAYGVAVTGTLHGGHPAVPGRGPRLCGGSRLWIAVAGALVFFTVDLAFLGANLTKIVHGGWFPLSVGAVMFVILSTWKQGSERLASARIKAEGPLRDFVEELRAIDPPLVRVPGTAVYLNARRETTPLALRTASSAPTRSTRP